MTGSMRAIAVLLMLVACGGRQAVQPSTATVWGPPDDTMVLGIEADGAIVTAFIENRGSSPQRLIAKGVQLRLERPGWSTDVYDHSGAIQLDRSDTFVVIPPGDHVATPIDLGAKRRSIEPGTYTVKARYHSATAAVGDWWSGLLEAGPITVELR